MSSNLIRLVCMSATVATLIVGCSASEHSQRVETATLRLMQTTDLHAYMKGYDYYSNAPSQAYGLEHTAALIAQARAESANHLLIDNGDLIQGSALGDYVAQAYSAADTSWQHPVIAALNELQYDAANLGNHEFDYGLEFLQQTIAQAEFPYVSANLLRPNTDSRLSSEKASPYRAVGDAPPLIAPYVILERQVLTDQGQRLPLRVGIIGFLPPQIMQWNGHHLEGLVQVTDMVETAQHYIPKMRAEGADLVVAVPHSGLELHGSDVRFAEQATLQLAAVEGIDAILFGHQHRVFPGDARYSGLPGVNNEQGIVAGTPAVQPGYWGSHLGVIDLQLRYQDGWQVVGAKVENRALTGNAAVSDAGDTKETAGLAEPVIEAHEQTLRWLQQPVARVQAPLANYFARLEPDATVQLINQAQRAYAKTLQQQGELPAELPVLSAAAPFRNGGQGPHDYTYLPPGEVTLGEINGLYIYPNTLQVVEITGSELRDWLEMSARAYRQIEMQAATPEWLLRDDVASYNFDMIDGVSYEIQPHHPPRFNHQGALVDAANHRVYNLRYEGRLVAPDDRFLVATNNYRAGGGGNFSALNAARVRYQGTQEIRQLVAEYIQSAAAQKPAGLNAEVKENWHLVLPRGAQVQFRSSPSAAARALAARLRDIEFVEIDETGYGIYRVLP